jgi:hypothetical protein
MLCISVVRDQNSTTSELSSSFLPEGNDRINARGAQGRNDTAGRANAYKDQRRHEERRAIMTLVDTQIQPLIDTAKPAIN